MLLAFILRTGGRKNASVKELSVKIKISMRS
jgi:hypothetical protein